MGSNLPHAIPWLAPLACASAHFTAINLHRPPPPSPTSTDPHRFGSVPLLFAAMSDLLAARSQMGVSLAFHIIFAVAGIAMPVMMLVAERRWQVTGHAIYLDLAQRWAKGTAILFAVGAVSGTVLSFELGLLWPEFMRFAGPIIGMPFSLEGFAFFTEAIFLGIYLYGWDRIPPRAHLAAGVIVADRKSTRLNSSHGYKSYAVCCMQKKT